jgi:cell division protein FtsL
MSAARNFSAYNYDEVMHQEIIDKSLRLKKTHQIQMKKTSWINRLLAVLMIVIVFGSMAYLLIRYAEINEIKYRNFELKQDIEELDIQVEELKLQIESAMSLENIEDYAVEKLGMQYPKPEQIVYLSTGSEYALNNVEKNGDIVDNGDIVVETVNVEKQGFFAMIVDTFRN